MPPKRGGLLTELLFTGGTLENFVDARLTGLGLLEQLRRAGRVGRPVTGNAKQLIAIRVAPRLLAQLRRLAPTLEA